MTNPHSMTIIEMLNAPVRRRRWRCWFGFHLWTPVVWISEISGCIRGCLLCSAVERLTADEYHEVCE